MSDLRYVLFCLLVPALAVLAPNAVHAAGQWSVDSDASSLSFTSAKNGNAAVGGTFNDVSGTLTLDSASGAASGTLRVGIPSMTTGNPARDSNITQIFFGLATNKPDVATYTINGVEGETSALATPGQSARLLVKGTLELAGVKAPFDLPVIAIVHGDGSMLVMTAAPTPITFADFGLSAAADTLKVVCNHSSLLRLATLSSTLILRPK